MPPQRITVFKAGDQVFDSVAGLCGLPDSACRDFICFSSPIVGAAGYYLAYEEWAERIAPYGYETVILTENGERRISAQTK